ncbi:MAG TPA: hypothetical protein DIU06_05705, partial [Rhodospirillaceae bacterium]|nr:hypothetical protein [Rhodospirillaceae bacterium]
MHLNQTYPITDILNLPIEIDRFIIDANIHKNQRANIIINHSNHLVMLDALFGYLTQQEQQCNLYKRYSTYTTPVDNIMTRPMWSKALGEYHCAIPVTGFYKWKQEHPQATPYYYQPKDNQIAYLAGFYNFNETNSNYSFSVLTCASQMQSQKEEHGMPLVMNYEQAMAWLD